MRQLGLTEDEARGAVAAFLLTDTETLVSFVPGLVALAHDNGWLAPLAAEPAWSGAVVAEAMRVTVPQPVMLRGVVGAGRVGAVAVRPGDRIVVAALSCARAYGPFDPRRPHPPELRQLWFGAGAHFCLGISYSAAIARRLYLAEKTVESHIAAVPAKLRLDPTPDSNRRVLAVLAFLRATGT